jgi:hypothetical protein
MGGQGGFPGGGGAKSFSFRSLDSNSGRSLRGTDQNASQ